MAVSQAGLLPATGHYSPAQAVSSQSIIRHDQPQGHAAKLVAAPVAYQASPIAYQAAPVYHSAPAPVTYHAAPAQVQYHAAPAQVQYHAAPAQVQYHAAPIAKAVVAHQEEIVSNSKTPSIENKHNSNSQLHKKSKLNSSAYSIVLIK